MLQKRLKELRKVRGLYQGELADVLNVSQATVASWENGTRKPDLEMLIRIADFYGVSTDILLGRETEETKEERESWELREQLRRDPERRILFDLTKDGDIDDIRQAVAVIDALKKTRR